MTDTEMINYIGVPNGIRTRVAAVKGRCPRPLDDGDHMTLNVSSKSGGARRARTADLLRATQAFSQLNYSPAVDVCNSKQVKA
tara:strand:+ start:31596 stop:31844 length:249 start_codon:yes stop_codon:yes gene_type:complete